MNTPVFQTPSDGIYFFGYYDLSALNAASTRLLAHRVPFLDRLPRDGEAAEIGYFDFPDGQRFHRLARTFTWNWQMGAMLQWLGPDYDTRVIFNDLRNGHFVSVIHDLETNDQRILPFPVYAVEPSGKTAACVDFERLYWFRPGYTYQGIRNQSKKANFAPEDGIWVLDLESASVEQVVFLKDLVEFQSVASMDGAEHYLEHITYAPGGRHIAFQHRWRGADGAANTRLFVLSLRDRELRLVSDSGRLTHYCWRDDETILAFGGAASIAGAVRRRPTLLKAFIKPMLPVYYRIRGIVPALRQILTQDSYTLIDVESGSVTRLTSEHLAEDGHPTFRPGWSSVFATDTYANDKTHTLCLILFDLDSNAASHIATLSSSSQSERTGWRCDLHPKWSFDGCYLTVDTEHGGGRGIHVYEIAHPQALQ